MTESISDATLSDRKQVFYLQSSCLQDLLSTQGHDNLVLTDDFKIPDLLINRFLSDDLSSQGRKVDNEEATLLSILDGKGRISTSARLTEFMVVMSRVYKVIITDGRPIYCLALFKHYIRSQVDHRALCIHALATKLSEQCEKDFLKFGGYRIIKRWFQLAENEDSVGELVKLLKLCRKLPFDEAAIREANIGKVIRKLKKFKSSKGSAGVGELNTQIENIMTKWRAKQQQLAEMAAVLAKNNSAVVDAAVPVPMDTSDSMAEKQKDDVRVRGSIIPTSHPTIDQSSSESVPSTVKKNQVVENGLSSVSSGDGQAPQQLLVSAGRSKPMVSSVAAISFTGGIIRDVSATGALVTAGFTTSSATTAGMLNLAATFPNSATDISQRFQINGPAATSAATSENKPIVTVPPSRERKPLDMAESARRLLAMRAEKQQQQQSQLQQPTDGTNKTDGAVATDEPSSVATDAPTPTVTSILSAVGKESIMNGLAKTLKDNEPAPLRSALKKSSGDLKKKRVVQWADETGGLLREIHTIEVERIKRSTAHYSNTRELSKKERQFEKETHLSKVNEAMQKNTDWRTPTPLVLSIAVLDNMSAAAESKEKEAQDKRLLHVLEVRYLDDSLIPNDPDDASTTSEAPSSSFFNTSSASVVNQSSANASTAADDCSECQLMPWYVPGTEPTDHLYDSSSVDGRSMSMQKTVGVNQADGLFTNDVLLLGGGGRSNMSGVSSNYPINNYINNDLQFNGNFDSQFMNIVSQLPLSLQRLDIQSLQLLVYDPALLQSLLLSDGTVDEIRLANFQQQRNMNNFANMNANQQQQQQRFSRFDSSHQQAFNPTMPMGNAILNRNSNGIDNSDMGSGGFRKPNSRWGDKATNDQTILADQSSLAYPPSYNNSFPTHGLPHNNNTVQRAMSIPNSGIVNPDGSIHNQQLFGDWSGDHRMNNPIDSSMNYDSAMKRPISQVSTIDHSAKNLKFPSTKAATPCRFFNTVKGCQFGDKCPFGHFLGSAPMKNNFSRQPMAPAIDPFQSNDNMMSSSIRSNTRFGQVQQQQQPHPYGATSSFQPMGGSNISDEQGSRSMGPGSIASHYGPGSLGGAKGKQRRLK